MMNNKPNTISWIILLIIIVGSLFLVYLSGYRLGHQEVLLAPDQSDNWWHMGYLACEINFNYTAEEQMAVNLLRIKNIKDQK